MSAGVQGSIFDLDAESPRLRELGSHVERRVLTKGAWVDLRPGWIAGSTDLFDALRDDVPWRAERRRMYDRVVDVAVPESVPGSSKSFANLGFNAPTSPMSSAAMTTHAPITHHLWRNENRPTRNKNDAICVHSLEKTRTFR